MKTAFNPGLIPSPIPNINNQYPERFCICYSTRTKFFNGGQPHPTLVVKCSSSNDSSEQGESASLKDLLSGIVDERVEELLNREENRALLDGLEKATQRVEVAKRELAEIERQEIQTKQLKNYISQLENRASEIEGCQKVISEAKAMVEEAEGSFNVDVGAEQSATVSKNEERLESIKAASISALVGTLAGLPIALSRVSSNSQLILPLSITFVSCALFGVTFRYAIRRDLDNFQLKSGTSAAFGFVKGLATLDGGSPLELDAANFLSHAFDGAVYVSENLLIFLFASVALDFCIKMRFLSPFPIAGSVSNTNER